MKQSSELIKKEIQLKYPDITNIKRLSKKKNSLKQTCRIFSSSIGQVLVISDSQDQKIIDISIGNPESTTNVVPFIFEERGFEKTECSFRTDYVQYATLKFDNYVAKINILYKNEADSEDTNWKVQFGAIDLKKPNTYPSIFSNQVWYGLKVNSIEEAIEIVKNNFEAKIKELENNIEKKLAKDTKYQEEIKKLTDNKTTLTIDQIKQKIADQFISNPKQVSDLWSDPEAYEEIKNSNLNDPKSYILNSKNKYNDKMLELDFRMSRKVTPDALQEQLSVFVYTDLEQKVIFEIRFEG